MADVDTTDASMDNSGLTTVVVNMTNATRLMVMPESDCNLFPFIIYVGVFGPMCVFGLCGNTISFLVLQWEKQNHAATFLLQTMAIADNIFLLASGFSLMISATLPMIRNNNYSPVTEYVQVYVWPLVYITQMWTVWITVLIALNRYIAICRPFQAQLLCTLSKVRLQVALTAIATIVYNIPRFLEHRIVHVPSPDAMTNTTQILAKARETLMKHNLHYNIIYENLLYCLFVFLGPLIILIFLNISLARELYAIRQRLLQRHLPQGSDSEEHNLTLVMMVIVLVFIICQTPAFGNQLLYYCLHYSCGRPYFFYFHISNLLVQANSCFNFVIYCAFRKQFRARLHAFCMCCRHPVLTRMHAERRPYNAHQTVSVYTECNAKTQTRTCTSDEHPQL
ncbi:hypothetical protein LSAT2_019977 [Lamellibrachia satsuma]|nr:hypothetical protein LSAT2_019977 [Lamellibrachia satsuma]